MLKFQVCVCVCIIIFRRLSLSLSFCSACLPSLSFLKGGHILISAEGPQEYWLAEYTRYEALVGQCYKHHMKMPISAVELKDLLATSLD